MRTSFIVVIALLFNVMFSYGQVKNLLSNPGFENDVKSWSVKTAKIDSEIRHSGKNSLHYVSNDPKKYQVLLTHIPVRGGEILDFSVWVKGHDVKALSSFVKKGAGIYLHAYDSNNKSLEGSSPPTLVGTFDWSKLEGRFELPKEAVKVAVSLYLVKGTTGEVWFDDVSVSYAAKNRGNLQASSLRSTRKSSDTRVYVDADGFTVKEGKRVFPYGFFVAKGEKQGISKDLGKHLRNMRDAGFNTVLSYYYGDQSSSSDYLKMAEENGLNVIYNLADMYDGAANYTNTKERAIERLKTLVKRHKDSPALLSWYLADELELSHVLAAEKNYQAIKENDPHHPVFQVNHVPDNLVKIYHTSDVIGTDAYPVDNPKVSNLGKVTEFVSVTQEIAKEYHKGHWQAVQVFNKGIYYDNKVKYEDPTELQIKNMIYQSIIGGAKGVLLYAYNDLFYGYRGGDLVIMDRAFEKNWSKFSNINKELLPALPIILENQTVALKVKTALEVKYKIWKYDGAYYVMLTNLSGQSQPFVVEGKEILLEAYGALFTKI